MKNNERKAIHTEFRYIQNFYNTEFRKSDLTVNFSRQCNARSQKGIRGPFKESDNLWLFLKALNTKVTLKFRFTPKFVQVKLIVFKVVIPSNINATFVGKFPKRLSTSGHQFLEID